MCDYSLESAARRDAAVGDQLKTAKIGVHGTIGLVSRNNPATAVCLLPGARLVVSGIPAGLQQQWGVGEAAIATFQKRDGRDTYQRPMGFYHDGVVFDGTPDRLVLFQEFPLEIEISVETIPGIASDDPAPAQHEFALA
jgi:hypothetical protein